MEDPDDEYGGEDEWGEMEGEEEGMMMAGGYRYEAEVEAQDALSAQEVERLVERFMLQQQRVEQLQSENSKLTNEVRPTAVSRARVSARWGRVGGTEQAVGAPEAIVRR